MPVYKGNLKLTNFDNSDTAYCCDNKVFLQNTGIIKHTTLNNGLVNYYKFDGNLNDVISSNNLTNSGTTFVTGKINQGLAIRANQQASTIVTPFNVNSSHSISFHFMQIATNGGNFLFGITTSNFRGELIHIYTIGLRAIRLNGAGTDEFLDITNFTIQNNVWYHCVYVYDSSIATMKLYINGVLRGTKISTNTNIDFASAIPYTSIGGIWGITQTNNNLNIDEVGLWNRALTNSEILDLYNSGDGLSYN